MTALSSYQLQDTDNLKRWLFASLCVYVLTDVSLLLTAFARASDGAQGVAAIIHLLVLITTAVFYLRWVFVSNKNARALGATNMRHSPGWSVGWFFIPIAWLWKPYQAVKEIYQASHPDYGAENWSEAKAPGILPWWWGLWLFSGFLGQVSMRLAIKGMDATGIDALATLMDVVLVVIAIIMVNTMSDWQKQKRRAQRASIAARA